MSVVGIIILVTLLLILKLITQMAVAESVPVPEITEAELNERIESLEQSRREIQDELARLNEARRDAIPVVPSVDQFDALQASIERLKADVQRADEDLQRAKERRDEINNRPDAKLAADLEKKIHELERFRDELERQSDEQKNQQQTLQAKIDALKNQQADLDRQLSEKVVNKVYATPNKSTDKSPILLVYGQGKINAMSQADPNGTEFVSRQVFYSWAKGKNRKTEYFVLYVRPSRFKDYESIIDELKGMGFEIGLQVIGEKTEIALQ